MKFDTGHSPFLASSSLSGPWQPIPFTSCNNPAPLVIPGRPEIYVYCHGGPDTQHYGSSVGMTWTTHWKSGVWHTAANNTEDIHGSGKDLFGHPVEDPFAWHAPSSNPLANGSFHLLCHGFRMGMANNSDSNTDRSCKCSSHSSACCDMQCKSNAWPQKSKLSIENANSEETAPDECI